MLATRPPGLARMICGTSPDPFVPSSVRTPDRRVQWGAADSSLPWSATHDFPCRHTPRPIACFPAVGAETRTTSARCTGCGGLCRTSSRVSVRLGALAAVGSCSNQLGEPRPVRQRVRRHVDRIGRGLSRAEKDVPRSWQSPERHTNTPFSPNCFQWLHRSRFHPAACRKCPASERHCGIE